MPKPKRVKAGSGSALEVVVPPGKRRTFSPADKLRIVQEAAECHASGEVGAIGALLRRERLHSSHLTTWRRALEEHGAEGLKATKRGRQAKHDAKDLKIAELEKKLGKTERELAIANGLLEIQKKVSMLLGVTLPKSEKS